MPSRPPIPWSYSSLDKFTTCPAQFHALKVVKTAADVPGAAGEYGNYVHKAFELRLKDGTPLPADLAQHEDKLIELSLLPGEKFYEQRMALDRTLAPSAFFARHVWSRGVVDFLSVDGDRAWVVDYKTGKRVPTSKQLQLCALYVFHTYPAVQQVEGSYYMTMRDLKQPAPVVFTRAQIPELWAKFTPDLKQYVEAFKTDIWQERPSGLCRGWCPVTHCAHWEKKRDS